MDPFTLSAGRGESAHLSLAVGVLATGHMDTCARAYSRVCKGLEVFFSVCILCGHTVVLMPVNEHMVASRS